MQNEDLLSLLDRIAVRHPCGLLTSEHLVAYVGYGPRAGCDKSLDGLIGARFVTRSQNPLKQRALFPAPIAKPA
jgi:hypothetical protein